MKDVFRKRDFSLAVHSQGNGPLLIARQFRFMSVEILRKTQLAELLTEDEDGRQSPDMASRMAAK